MEQQLDAELRFHIERQTAENIATGLAPDEARRQAVLQLGAAEGVKEDCREQRRGFWMETLWADIRYGLRILREKSRLHGSGDADDRTRHWHEHGGILCRQRRAAESLAL